MEDLQNSHTSRPDMRRPSPVSMRSDQKSEISESTSVDSSAGETTTPSKSATTLELGTTVSANSSLGTNPTPSGTGGSRRTSPQGLEVFEPDTSSLPGKELQEALLSADVKKASVERVIW